MAKSIFIKLTRVSIKTGPFRLITNTSVEIATNVSREDLINGITYSVADNITSVTISSIGKCKTSKTINLGTITPGQIASAGFTKSNSSCLWVHLKTPSLFNSFYGNIEPYIIEYPFTYKFQDEILQSVKDYTRVFKYNTNPENEFNDVDKIELNNVWFNKAILYNSQQSSGVLELVSKPLNNMRAYLSYPIYNTNSKTILFTKNDNFYQYNSFWNVLKNTQVPGFTKSCESLSIDKIINQSNMDYSTRAFKKEPLRAKDLKVRHILDNRDDVQLISQFIITQTQNSYK